MKSNRFYMACLRDTCGSTMAFHGAGGGYVTDLRKAETYTLEQAQGYWGRDIDLPVCADRVDALATMRVDIQHLRAQGSITEVGCTEYVAFRNHKFDGNDLPWIIDKDGRNSFDYTRAFIVDPRIPYYGILTFLPKHLVDAIQRPTFQIKNLNRRKMVQAAGLIIPNSIKRNSRRKANPKNMHNCPGCGKISWQYNPYDFEGCNDPCCSEHRGRN